MTDKGYDLPEVNIGRENFVKVWGFMLVDLKLEKAELMWYNNCVCKYKTY